MTAAVAAALIVLALLDGAFAGFRSSVGRTGLIHHRASDQQAARRGAVLVIVLLAPAGALAIADVLANHHHLRAYMQAGSAMLMIYAPYALLALAALACYTAAGWRLKYLASAVILGPFTLLRPAVAIAGAVVGTAHGNDGVVTTTVVLSVMAVLAVEPLAGRRWYAPAN